MGLGVSDVGRHQMLVESLPPHQRLLFGFGPCYLLALVVTLAELTLGQGGDLLFVRHCSWMPTVMVEESTGEARNPTICRNKTDGQQRWTRAFYKYVPGAARTLSAPADAAMVPR